LSSRYGHLPFFLQVWGFFSVEGRELLREEGGMKRPKGVLSTIMHGEKGFAMIFRGEC